MVDLTGLDPVSGALWDALIDLAAVRRGGWTLIGAQMVALHGLEHGRVLARSTTDADVLVDARSPRWGTAALSQLLVDRGFELEGFDSFGIGHRFGDGRVRIDVLAPDGLPVTSPDLVTTVAPARTVSVPGGTQALRRSRHVGVHRGDQPGSVPCPDLLGAILIKARAVDVDDVPRAQLSDLAFLLGLVEDPRALAGQLRGRERSWLRRRTDLLDRSHPAWESLPDREAEDGHIALKILAGV